MDCWQTSTSLENDIISDILSGTGEEFFSGVDELEKALKVLNTDDHELICSVDTSSTNGHVCNIEYPTGDKTTGQVGIPCSSCPAGESSHHPVCLDLVDLDTVLPAEYASAKDFAEPEPFQAIEPIDGGTPICVDTLAAAAARLPGCLHDWADQAQMQQHDGVSHTAHVLVNTAWSVAQVATPAVVDGPDYAEVHLQLQCEGSGHTLAAQPVCNLAAAACLPQPNTAPWCAPPSEPPVGQPGYLVLARSNQVAGQSLQICCAGGVPQQLQPQLPCLGTAGSISSDINSSSPTWRPVALPNAPGLGPVGAAGTGLLGTTPTAGTMSAHALQAPLHVPTADYAFGSGVSMPAIKMLQSDRSSATAKAANSSGSSAVCCQHCAKLKPLGDQCCTAVLAGNIDASTREHIAEFLLLAANCPCETACLHTAQLPAAPSFGSWQLSMSMARFSASKQRAGVGTRTPRNFNYNANTPTLLGNYSKLVQLQRQGNEETGGEGSAVAASAAVSADSQFYSVRSSQRTDGGSIISYGLAKNARLPPDTGASSSSTGNNSSRPRKARVQPVGHWVEGGMRCSKLQSKFRGWQFDLHAWAFFVAVADQSCTGTAGDKLPGKRKQPASQVHHVSCKLPCNNSS